MRILKNYIRLISWQILWVLRFGGLLICSLGLAMKAWTVLRNLWDYRTVGPFSDIVIMAFLVIAVIALQAVKDQLNHLKNHARGQLDVAVYARRVETQENTQREQGVPIAQEPSVEHYKAHRRTFRVMCVSSAPEEELAHLVGLNLVKEQVAEIKDLLTYERKNGVSGGSRIGHMAFMGNPGTGKTTIGKIMAGILYRERQIPRNKYVEVNANELLGEFVGQTAPIVRDLFDQAAGGVLFIDEAYALAQSGTISNYASYGSDAVSQLLSLLENRTDGTVVIFAGYQENMEAFFRMNPGLPSRIPYTIGFPDYTPLELCQILEMRLKHMQVPLGITREAMELVYETIRQKQVACYHTRTPFGNGRYIRNVADVLYRRHAKNAVRGDSPNNRICLADVDQDTLLALN